MNPEFGLIEPFDIDDGELDGLTPQMCFVLGYELAEVKYNLGTIMEPFGMYLHAENQHRVKHLCDKSRREWKLEWMPADESESWMILNFGPPPEQQTQH